MERILGKEQKREGEGEIEEKGKNTFLGERAKEWKLSDWSSSLAAVAGILFPPFSSPSFSYPFSFYLTSPLLSSLPPFFSLPTKKVCMVLLELIPPLPLLFL